MCYYFSKVFYKRLYKEKIKGKIFFSLFSNLTMYSNCVKRLVIRIQIGPNFRTQIHKLYTVIGSTTLPYCFRRSCPPEQLLRQVVVSPRTPPVTSPSSSAVQTTQSHSESDTRHSVPSGQQVTTRKLALKPLLRGSWNSFAIKQEIK